MVLQNDYMEGLRKLAKLLKPHLSLLKLVSAIFYQIFIFTPNDSPSKTMKNAFYFI